MGSSSSRPNDMDASTEDDNRRDEQQRGHMPTLTTYFNRTQQEDNVTSTTLNGSTITDTTTEIPVGVGTPYGWIVGAVLLTVLALVVVALIGLFWYGDPEEDDEEDLSKEERPRKRGARRRQGRKKRNRSRSPDEDLKGLDDWMGRTPNKKRSPKRSSPSSSILKLNSVYRAPIRIASGARKLKEALRKLAKKIGFPHRAGEKVTKARLAFEELGNWGASPSTSPTGTGSGEATPGESSNGSPTSSRLPRSPSTSARVPSRIVKPPASRTPSSTTTTSPVALTGPRDEATPVPVQTSRLTLKEAVPESTNEEAHKTQKDDAKMPPGSRNLMEE